MKPSLLLVLSLSLILPLVGLLLAADSPAPKPSDKPVGPLSPREALATFRVAKGFKVELVAAEPEVIDPVVIAFDEEGRLFVVEMLGYPNGGLGEGKPVLPGRIKLLEDRDGDGYFEHATVYVDDLRFPTGVTPWNGGILVGNAPDLLFCKDTDGDGKADVRKVLYTGFGQKNIQQLLNSLQFHQDNWIHGCNGSNDSVIRSEEKPDLPALALRGRHFRFRPDQPGNLEPMSGGGQYGMASDDWGNWFTCTNSQHLRHIVLSDHYLKRNPHLPVTAVVLDIPDKVAEHTAAAKVYRISPFEPWRLERTAQRVKDPGGRTFAPTELVPGGYITSACGLSVYRGGAFPEEYRGNVFVCDPANNLIHRDVLEPAGATFVAKRHDKDCEFLASTDTWFRPVFLTHGPDGALYVADFYREVIETPLSLPEEIQKKYNLQSRERGRIWRIVPENRDKLRQPALGKATPKQLVEELANPNAWRRLTAQRLLIERQPKDPDTRKVLEALARDGKPATTRLHALWTLQGLGALDPDLILLALEHREPGLREQGLILAESLLKDNEKLQAAVLKLVDDPAPRVRFQLAFTLGSMNASPETAAGLAQLARRDGADPWMQTAILSSALPHAGTLLTQLATEDAEVPAAMLARIAGLVAANKDEDEIRGTLLAVLPAKDAPTLRQMTVLDGLAQGLARSEQPLAKRLNDKAEVGERLSAFLKASTQIAESGKAGLPERLAAVRIVGHAPSTTAVPVLERLLSPQTPGEIQLAAVQALSSLTDPKIADVLLVGWSGYSPSVRREVQEALFARADRLGRLLAAIEKKEVIAGQLDLARREQLLRHPSKEIRERAKALFADQIASDRKKVVDDHRAALDLKADAQRGKMVFQKNCTTCHRLENEGQEVGPDLLSALKTKTPEGLLIDILDPSREVDPRFLNYFVLSKAGRTFTGMIASETASTLLLRRAERAEDTLLRADIDQIQATSKSLMPEEMEKQLGDQDLADVIAYLLEVVRKK